MSKMKKYNSRNYHKTRNKIKISFNINKKTLELLDDLSKLTKSTRTMVILALIGKGVNNLVTSLERDWIKIKKDTNNMKIINHKLKELKGLRHKWKTHKYN